MKTYLLYIGITIGIIATFFLYAFEFQYFNRTFHMQALATWAIALGVIVGVLVAIRLQKGADNRLERIQVFIACIVIAVMLFPLLASLSNRLLSPQSVESVLVEFVEEKPYYGSRFGFGESGQMEPTYYRSFVYRDEDLLEIQTEQPLFSGASRGDTVQLPVKKGLWGIEYVPK